MPRLIAALSLSALCIPFALTAPLASLAQQPVLTGQAAFTDWSQQHPGVRHKITLADLPAPNPAQSVNMTPHIIVRPHDAWPVAPPGFKVTLYAGGDTTPMQRADAKKVMQRSGGTFTEPRLLRTAPNGDLFVADSGAGEIIVLRGVRPDGKAATVATFASGLDHPFGIAFYPLGPNPKWVYVGNATTIQRLPYKSGDLHAEGPAQTIVPNIPGYAQLMGGGHWTRDVVFTPKTASGGLHLLVSVGSGSNVDNADTHPREFHRADILEYTPDGKFLQVYAHGLRNCVGEAINPTTGQLWCSVNERDDLGNHLVPDYVTSVPEGSFFGWPWYYMGGHEDPRLPQPCANGTGPNPQLTKPLTPEEGDHCKHVDLSKQVRTPDVLVQPHMASLEMTFYPKWLDLPNEFPSQYAGDAFAAEHGSWNRDPRAGYEVILIPMHNGHATGEYDDFLTGFVTKTGEVWGRPVGVTVANDGSLFVTDDGSRSVWRVVYTGK
ncbi:MAG TPA: sorbosone dehydrogenase family protein [Acidobacteriaceae bacterium]|jgi:glucose/arabinose dehydrogenase|nr:sorbosone dehydrogenase family protein [Acidobacteriaceae bacterium]